MPVPVAPYPYPYPQPLPYPYVRPWPIYPSPPPMLFRGDATVDVAHARAA